jgi:N-ethylmaleimide reductase
MNAHALLTPYTMAGLPLANRMVMAPLTRSRATNPDLTPTDLHVKYYAQRASAGLIISEGVWISPDAVGWHDVPGLFTDAQIRAWSAVSDAVHAEGGVIFAQLWHTGSLSHPDFFSGTAPLAPSAVDPGLRSHTPSGLQPTVVPRAMTRADIANTIADYAQAAANARRAGFDGVQLQAGFSYLISQFLNPATNLRTDEYGGSMANRARLLFDTIDAVGERIDLSRVGIKAGPAWAEHGAFRSDQDTLETSDYVIGRLNDYPLSHLLLMTAMADLTGRPLEKLQGRGTYEHYRPLFNGTLIANVGISPESGDALVTDGLVDLVAFGQPFIANPDLPVRHGAGVALNTPDPTTLYHGGTSGYVDYPVATGA